MRTKQILEFIRAIDRGFPPRLSSEGGRVTMRVVEWAYASASGEGHQP